MIIKCETCLCSDRQLVCLSKIKSIIYEIQLPQILNNDGGICWECQSNMVKFYQFKNKVKQAQDVLSSNIENQQIGSLSTLTINTKQKYDFEYTFYYDPLINTQMEQNENSVKVETKVIKQEADYDDRINSDTDCDEKPLSKIFAESIKVNTLKERKRLVRKITKQQDKRKIKKNNLKKKSKYLKIESLKERNKIYLKKEHQQKSITNECLSVDKKSEDSKLILNEKFEMVIFTEEEMLKCREEKRNQANFKKIPFKCNSCVTGFTKKENYELHLKKIHDENIGIHACSVCEARFSSKAAETRHHTKHYRHYKCRLCDYKVSSGTAAINHGKEKHANDDTGKIHCKQCSFIARTSKELSEHARIEHCLVCNECGVKFKGRNTLRSHKIRIHSVKREFSCQVCLKTFTSLSRLQAHSSKHPKGGEGGNGGSEAHCALCGVQYKDVHVYRNHLRNSKNHVQDRISCPDCGKKFASRVYWTKHYNFYHLRRSRHKCGDCDKLFISEWRLKVHKQTHHGLARTRDHACTVCEKKFYTKATLVTHLQLHAASRAFMCAGCGATFRQRAALYTHTRLVHPDKYNTIK